MRASGQLHRTHIELDHVLEVPRGDHGKLEYLATYFDIYFGTTSIAATLLDFDFVGSWLFNFKVPLGQSSGLTQ